MPFACRSQHRSLSAGVCFTMLHHISSKASQDLLLAADGFDAADPHEGRRVFVPGRQERFKPSGPPRSPPGAGGDKVQHEVKMALQPSPHLGMFVRAVVIHDQMERNLARKFLIEPAQDAEIILMPNAVDSIARSPCPAASPERRIESWCSAAVIVGNGPATAFLDRQAQA